MAAFDFQVRDGETSSPPTTTTSGGDDLDGNQLESDLSGDHIAGGGGTETDSEREVYLRRAQTVVDESNELAAKGEDQVWLAQNSTNQGVMPDNDVKPDEWKRGISTKGGEFGYVHGAEATGIEDMQEFREQIVHDLNFNGVFDDYASSEEFEEALIAQYGQGSPERKEQVRHIARNIWSYGTVGADVEGNTDVAEFQGLLYSLDPLIAEASRSNTKHENTFTIPGTDLELGTGGDDYYGRATMLEARLLSSILDEPVSEPESEPGPTLDPEIEDEPDPVTDRTPGDDDVFGRTHFLSDISASMYDDFEFLADYLEEVDFGETRIGGLRSYFDELNWHAGGEAVPMEEGREIMHDLSRVGLKRGERGNSYGRKKDRAREISDAFERIGGGREESPITTALSMLREMQEQGHEVDLIEGEQIVIATDEGDSKPEQLRELRDLAREMGVLVKVLYFTSSGSNGRGAVFEISINAIKDETLDLFESQLSEAKQEDTGAHQTAFHRKHGFDRMVTIRRHDDRRTEEEGGKTFHQELLWHRLAEADDPNFVVVEDMKDRESRRDD